MGFVAPWNTTTTTRRIKKVGGAKNEPFLGTTPRKETKRT
jgi:hypothetical protein